MVLSKIPVQGRPTKLDFEKGKGLLRLQWVRVGVVWTFFLSSINSLFFLPLSGRWERRPDRLKYCLKRLLSRKQPTDQMYLYELKCFVKGLCLDSLLSFS